MRRRLFGQNIKFFKFFDQKNLGSLPRIFICSIILIFFFYSMPKIVDFTINENAEYQNNSKTILANTLNNKTDNAKENDQVLDENDLLVDIFSLNELETDTVRLNAATIKQLFEDTNYTLDDVRKKISKTSCT